MAEICGKLQIQLMYTCIYIKSWCAYSPGTCHPAQDQWIRFLLTPTNLPWYQQNQMMVTEFSTWAHVPQQSDCVWVCVLSLWPQLVSLQLSWKKRAPRDGTQLCLQVSCPCVRGERAIKSALMASRSREAYLVFCWISPWLFSHCHFWRVCYYKQA